MDKQTIVFDNLIEVKKGGDQYGQKLTMDCAEPFVASNAAGSIRPMTQDDIIARAASFGKRFKQAMAQ